MSKERLIYDTCQDCGDELTEKRINFLASWETPLPRDRWLCIRCQGNLEKYQNSEQGRGSVVVRFGAMAISSEDDDCTGARERGIVAIPERAVFTAKRDGSKVRLTA